MYPEIVLGRSGTPDNPSNARSPVSMPPSSIPDEFACGQRSTANTVSPGWERAYSHASW